MLHVEADQAITRKMTTNVFTEPYALFHENDLGAFLLFCIKCYVSEANQAMNQKGKVTVDSERSESLFATALNQRTTYFRTLSQKSCANANLLTGPNNA